MDSASLIAKVKLYWQVVLDKVDNAIQSERDRRALIIGVVVIAAVLIFAFYNTFVKNSKRYQKQTVLMQERLIELKVLKKEYLESKQKLNELTKTIKKEDEALISVVEKILVDNQIERTSFSIKDSKLNTPNSDEIYDESTVQVDLRKIPFNKVIDILYMIQSRDSFLKVSNLRLKTKFDKPELVDFSFKLSTFEFRQDV